MSVVERARELRAVIEDNAQQMDDTAALEAVELFPGWKPGVAYEAGVRVSYVGVLYRVTQGHTSQEGWEPNKAPSLFAKVLTADDGTPLPWEQPDSTNAYMKGDKVTHNGSTWVSLVDNNVWEPSEANAALWAKV